MDGEGYRYGRQIGGSMDMVDKWKVGGWIGGWMGGWIGGVDGWMDGWIGGNGWMDRRMDGGMDRWMDGWIRWMDGKVDG